MGGLAANLFNVTNSDGVAITVTGFLGARIPRQACLPECWPTGIASWTVPIWARGLMPVLIIPLFTCVIGGLTMIIVLGKPIGWLMEQLKAKSNSAVPSTSRSACPGR